MKLAIGLVFAGAVVAILVHEKSAGESVPLQFDHSDDAETPPDSGDAVSYEEDSPVSEAVKNVIAGARASLWGTKYDSLIANSADANGVDRDVLYKLLYAESHFRDDIISGKVQSRTGALGIAQFMPATAREELGSVAAALDPNQAIPGAARYLAKLIRQAGSVVGGVAAYNWGIGNVLKKGLDMAPAETRNYVAQITGSQLA